MNVNRIWHLLRRSSQISLKMVRLALLQLANLYGRLPITGSAGPVVSLTTYGARARSVHLAIESIGRGRMLPSRLILWIDEAALFENLPAGIRRLQKRGLEVRSCKDYGPHKKYFPYLESLREAQIPLVTADDDLLYPRDWLQRLAEAFQKYPGMLNCYRAHLVALDRYGVAPYKHWSPVCSTRPSFRHFATSGAGIILPTGLQRILKQKGASFLRCCPKADDIWLNVQALRAGYLVRTVARKQFRLLGIPGTQKSALSHQNCTGEENDRQIAATYTHEDMQIMFKDGLGQP